MKLAPPFLRAFILSAAIQAFLPLAVIASGILTLQGRLTTLSPGVLVVDTGKAVYTLDRKKIQTVEPKDPDRTEIPVRIACPFEAVTQVTFKKTAAAPGKPGRG